MPALIAVFSVGAYGFGAAVRGADVIVNQIAIVRGGPDATVGTGIVYLGVFSPTRGSYDVEVAPGALLSSAIAADFFGGDSGSLDIVQGEPARVRQLAVGFGSLRTIRAEAPAEVPRIQADLLLRDGRVEGTVTNASDIRLERAAVVVGSTAKHIGDLEPGASVDVSFVVAGQGFFGATISEQILGDSFFDGSLGESTAFQRTEIRRAVLDQLTYDPWTGWSNALPNDGAVLLAFADRPVLDVTIAGQEPQRTGETLYYLPVDLPAQGRLVVSTGLFRTSVIESSALFFSPDPFGTGLGQGSATVAYQPLTFGGSVEPDRLFVSIAPGGGADINPNRALEAEVLLAPPNYCAGQGQGQGPVDDPDEPCVLPPLDGTPDIELFDRTGEGFWTPFAHFSFGSTYEIPNPERYVDPGSGTVLVRYVNPGPNEAYFGFGIRLEGTVR
jgi:hypothetical protein